MNNCSPLSNTHITLRALEPTDLDLLYEWENEASLWVASSCIAPYSRQMLWKYLQENSNDIYQTHELRLVATLAESGQAIGIVDFTNFDPLNNRAELGLLIAPPFQGKGLGRHTLDIATRYALECIGLRQLYVFIAHDNVACLSLFAEAGFELAGVLKSWQKRGHHYHDVHLLQCIF